MNATLPAMPAFNSIHSQADSDERLIELWMHGRGPHTKRAYQREAGRFLAHAGKPLRSITLGDVQAYADSIEALSPASRSRALAVVKSLFGFAHRIGYVPFNVAAAVKLPKAPSKLAARIMTEAEVVRLIGMARSTRDRTLLLTAYASGARASELVGLRWSDVQARDQGCQITVWGKGSKERAVLLPVSVAEALAELRGNAAEDAAVFASRSGRPLHQTELSRIVRRAARAAGMSRSPSMHWLRHAHASHALDRGAPVHVVQTTLGHGSLTTTSRYTHARPTESSAKWLAV